MTLLKWTLIAITVACFSLAAYAEDTPMTAWNARLMITGIGIAKTASELCRGMALDDDTSEKLMGLARQTLGNDVADRVLAHEVKQAAKSAAAEGKHEWCEMIKRAPGYSTLLTITDD
jgi:hypothetical protein